MDWPTLPQPRREGYVEEAPDNVVRSTVDTGAAKVRRRSTAAPRKLSLTYLLTQTEIATLDYFYVTTSQSGSLSFNFTHPRTNAIVVARFLKPPKYSEFDLYAIASVELELLA